MSKNEIRFLAGVFLMPALVACGPSEKVESEPSAVAFVGVNVLPMDEERILEGQTVVTEGDRIVAAGPSGELTPPAGAVVVEGAGKYLLPGMGEMHGHIPPPTEQVDYLDAVLFLYVANGVTTVRGMLGHANQLQLREKANRGEILAPSLYLAGPSFSGRSVSSVDEAVERVRRQKSEGWDLLKIHPGLSLEVYDAIARTAQEVGIPFAGHVPAGVGLEHAFEMGQQTIDHLDGYIEFLEGDQGPVPQEKLVAAARLTREAGAWAVPTMALWETLLGVPEVETLRAYPELQYIPREQVESWVESHQQRRAREDFDLDRAKTIAENRQRLLKVFSDEAVKILFGTDAPQQFSVPGFSMHREVKHMAAAGMSPYEILYSGTAAVGEYLKGKDSFGTVAAGQRADLILLEANPLNDVANLARRAGVMVRGRWLTEEEIQQRLAAIAEFAAR